MEICEHSVHVNGEKVTVSLEGYHKGDAYGTNLELTGLGNWFGSMNMCNMMGDNSAVLFGSDDISREYGGADATESAVTKQDNNFCMLELGSGLGRAGLMGMKLIELEALRSRNIDKQAIQNTMDKQGQNIKALHEQSSWRCVLTDGEDEIVTLLDNNYIRNITSQQSTTDDAGNQLHSTRGSSCQQLWWGPNAELTDLQERFPSGFDLIIGADLIYGRDAVPEPDVATTDVPAELMNDATAASEAPPTDAGTPAAVGGFCRDKLRSLLYTVCALLSKRGSSLDATTAVENTNTSNHSRAASIFDVQRRPAFFLAVTRRELLPMEELSALALSVGLCVNMLDDYTFDIFDTNVDSESLFWRDTILSFTRV